MKKIAFLFMVAMGFSTLSLTGCGSTESKVIEAPAVEEVDPVTEGMTQEEYDKQMDMDMQ